MVKRLVGIGDYLVENLTLRRNGSAARLVNQRGDIHVFIKADLEELSAKFDYRYFEIPPQKDNSKISSR